MPKEYDAAKGRPAGAGNRLAGELSLREKILLRKEPHIKAETAIFYSRQSVPGNQAAVHSFSGLTSPIAKRCSRLGTSHFVRFPHQRSSRILPSSKLPGSLSQSFPKKWIRFEDRRFFPWPPRPVWVRSRWNRIGGTDSPPSLFEKDTTRGCLASRRK